MKTRLIKLIDVLFGKILCSLLGYLDYLFNLSPKDLPIGDPRKFLVIRPGGLGDFLYLLPMLKELRKKFPGATIHVLAESRNQTVKDLTDNIDKLLCYDAHPFSTLLKLRKNRYDLVIDSEQFHNFSAVLAYWTRARIRIGFKTNPFRNHLYTHLIDYSLKGSEPKEFLSLLEPLGIKVESPTFKEAVSHSQIMITLLPREFSEIRKRVDSIALIAPRSKDRYRHWAPEKYRAVIQYLLNNPKQAAVLVGGKSEARMVKEITKNLPPTDRLISLAGKTSLLELCRVILQSNLFFGVDSGIAVLAAALGIKSVLLFGSTDEKKWGLEDKEHLVVRSRLPCSPCYLLGSHKFCKNINCMEKISSKEVISAVQSLGF